MRELTGFCLESCGRRVGVTTLSRIVNRGSRGWSLDAPPSANSMGVHRESRVADVFKVVVSFVCSEEKGQGGKLDWLTVGELKRRRGQIHMEGGSNKAGTKKSTTTHCGIHIAI